MHARTRRDKIRSNAAFVLKIPDAQQRVYRRRKANTDFHRLNVSGAPYCKPKRLRQAAASIVSV